MARCGAGQDKSPSTRHSRGLSARTMRSYEEVVELLRHSLNGYAPNTLGTREHQRWERAFEAGDGDAFCHLFGPEHIPGQRRAGLLRPRSTLAGSQRGLR